jgi:hypothetical protein
MKSPTLLPLLALLTATAHPACAQSDHHHAHAMSDTGFAAMQDRGKVAMGVDQYTSQHHFVDLPDGGRIELQRDSTDTAGVRTIREHLKGIAGAFAAGNFSSPGFVHAEEVPGTAIMRERRAGIQYRFEPLPGGGDVRITTQDAAAITAVHEFLAFQRGEHRVTQPDTSVHHSR